MGIRGFEIRDLGCRVLGLGIRDVACLPVPFVVWEPRLDFVVQLSQSA